MNTIKEKGMTHDELVIAAVAAIRELDGSGGWGVTKRKIFYHLLERYPELTEPIMRAIDSAWQFPIFEWYAMTGDDVQETYVRVRELDKSESSVTEVAC